MTTAEADQQLAQISADRMWAVDAASHAMGMRLEAVAPGVAVLSMTVTTLMLGPGAVCKRGYIFALADSAMAFASCTHGQQTVAQLCDIAFEREVGAGTHLTARAVERHRAGRKGAYDVRVDTGDGFLVAEFRGQTIAVGSAPAPP